MNDLEELKNDFEKETIKLVEKIKKEVYTPTRFITMASESSYYEATKKVISKSEYTEGYIKLLDAGRLDLAVENLVKNKKYKPLFTETEIKWCNRILPE